MSEYLSEIFIELTPASTLSRSPQKMHLSLTVHFGGWLEVLHMALWYVLGHGENRQVKEV